jgi:hypothetical protein
MRKNKLAVTTIASLALLAGLGMPHPAMAQDATPSYPKMAPLEQYLMPDKAAEIALARSAAPASISHDATVLVLGHNGYEQAVQGKNGFVCWVARSWMGPFDWPEFWNPKVRGADCLNPQAARALVPVIYLRGKLAMAGRSKAEMVTALKAAYAHKQIPDLESGAMDYMMSKSSYLTDQGGHDMPHLMFFTQVKDANDWGSGAANSPVMSAPYWFFTPDQQAQVKGLPPILVFLVAVPAWSDGTAMDMQHN